MPWKETDLKQLAAKMGVDADEVREKQALIERIKKIRKKLGLTQASLAKKAGVTQGRIAQIESGIGTNMISFDVLLHLLTVMGYHFRIVSRKAA